MICPTCYGEGALISCCDDLCVGQGHCIHGDGEDVCPTCGGEGDVFDPLEDGFDPDDCEDPMEIETA